MKSMSLGPVVLRTSIAVACLALGPHPIAISKNPTAAVSKGGPAEHLVGRSIDAAGDYAGPVDVMIERWSTDEEVENVTKPMLGKTGPAAFLAALEKVRVRAGYVLTPGIQNAGLRTLGRRSWNIEFAREINTPAGRRIVVASQDHLPIGEFPKDVSRGTAHQLDVLEFRFDRDGKGVGKLVDGSKIAFNKAMKMIEIAKYDKEPVRLAAVAPQKLRTRTEPPKEYYGGKAR